MTQTTDFDIPPISREVDDLTDIEFLREVLAELDRGWTQGTMCDDSGKKCLVGAGASVLGFNYGSHRLIEDAYMQLEYELDVANEDRDDNATYSTLGDLLDEAYILSNQLEFASAERLRKLLPVDITLKEKNVNINDATWTDVDTVVFFNDQTIDDNDYATLRSVITKKIEELENE